MGWFFTLQHANVIAYLTAPTARPPRVTREHLSAALQGMLGGSDEGPALISRDEGWLSAMSERADAALSQLENADWPPSEHIPFDELEALLRPLRQKLSTFDVFGLLIDDRRHLVGSRELRAFATRLAYSTRGDALILMPLTPESSNLAFLDPIPAFAEALEHPDRWPGMVFWTATGTAAMVGLDDLDEAAAAIKHADRAALDAAIRDLAGASVRPRRILHLSDLHFGARDITPNVVLLEAQLSSVVKEVDRIAITGDLFDSPDASAAAEFRRFNAALHRLTGKKPIIIPGNHDVRLLGNIGSFYQHIAAQWQTVIVDHEIRVKFACFNSSESEAFAKGRIGAAQLNEVGGALQNEIAVKPEVESYLTVALVHHHPFPYPLSPDPTVFQRVWALLGGSPETFLRMEDADLFLDWCARWRVSAVLHGHKHVARHLTGQIQPEGAPWFDVTAIGCGSSLGAGGKPMSFVVLNWDERSRRWSTSFFESRNGGPFVRQAITSAVVPAPGA